MTVDTFEPSRNWVDNLNKVHQELEIIHDRRSVQAINGFTTDNKYSDNQVDLITIPYLGIRLLSFDICLRSVSQTNKDGNWTEFDVGVVSGNPLSSLNSNVPITNWGHGHLLMARIDERNHIKIHSCGQPMEVGDPVDIHVVSQAM